MAIGVVIYDTEPAALEWIEAITCVDRSRRSDVLAGMREHFSNEEIVHLIAICAINTLNRINTAFQVQPESADAVFSMTH